MTLFKRLVNCFDNLSFQSKDSLSRVDRPTVKFIVYNKVCACCLTGLVYFSSCLQYSHIRRIVNMSVGEKQRARHGPLPKQNSENEKLFF